MLERVENLREVDHRNSKNRLRAKLRFLKLIRNELRKTKNLNKSTLFRAETGLAGRENGVRLQKEELTSENKAFKKL